ncbi:probable tyrosyl-DNA phosphodiesterase [Penaeus japonicus]|uniref:probable tyrosyl-DNA phosphodiesterase n=1 Tax=Penaeus japonicus TaxID=27405 RepID=UPI001C716748|nr:probable tyrosyl-DNA phosphodiesterase [Penaeus japonicus]
MDSDEDLARKLQAQFDEEERLAREQEHGDAIFAQTLASQSHDLSESEEEVVEVNRDEEVPVREVVDLDSDVEDVGKDEGSSPQKMGSASKTVPQHTISDDETDIEDFEADRKSSSNSPVINEQRNSHNKESSPKKSSAPEHTLSDDETDIEDMEIPAETSKKKSAEENHQTETKNTAKQIDESLTRMRSEHSLSDDDTNTEELVSSSEVPEPPKTEKDEKSSSSSGNQQTPLKKNGSKEEANSSKKRPLCKFGADCYRKNPWHLEEFYHPHLEDKDGAGAKRKSESSCSASEPAEKRRREASSGSTMRKGSTSNRNMAFPARLAASSPFNFFVNKSFSVKETHEDPLSLVFPDLFNPQLGEIVESVQLNFMVDLEFLMTNYKAGKADSKPLLVMYGQMEGNPRDYTDVTCTKVNLPFQYGTHHTKMMIFQYTDSLRVVIHTANLVPNDWYEKTQGYWVSPAFPLLEGGKAGLLDGESPTRFKRDLVDYLASYKAPDLTRWTHIIKKYDFTSCNTVFVGSTPGYHAGEHKDKWGHMKARRAIRQHGGTWTSSVPIIAQCSSIGSLGKDAKSWLSGELGMSLTGAPGVCASAPKVNVIYPSEDDVCNSSEGWMGGSCLPYNSGTHAKQTWLTECMHCWRSDRRKRTRVMPHIKTYTRLNKSQSSAQFFLLTSANISKAAWGTLQKQNTQLFIRSYEAGILLLPKFLIDATEFPLSAKDLSLPYDVPLTPYPNGATPWFMNTDKSRPDIFGRTYP